MDRGAWWATVHGVAKSWTQLSWTSRHFTFSSTDFSPIPIFNSVKILGYMYAIIMSVQ